MFLAKLLSRLLHPIFIPTITLAIISTKFLNIIILSNQLNIIIIGTVIFTLLFPLLSILYLLLTKRIKSLQIEEKEERILPILFTIIWMLIGYYFLGNILEYAPVVNSIYLGMIATLGITLLITKYWKISLHMAAIGGCFGVFLNLQYLYGGVINYVIFILILSGLLGYSRAILKAHNMRQIYSGFLLGVLILMGFISYL
jgi:membrane-associated phospholipid phosphatase